MRHTFKKNTTIALLALLLATPALAESENPWIDTSHGSRWDYRATMDIEPELLGGGPLPSQSFEGKGSIKVIEAVPEPGTQGKLLTTAMKLEWNDGSLPAYDEKERSAIRNGDLYIPSGGNQLDALYLPKNPSVDTQLSPRQISTAHGNVVLTGQIQGVQDVTTPGGEFKNCLRILWTGSAEPSDGPLPNGLILEGGQVVETMWYAKGIGNVLQVTEEDLVLAGPNGRLNMRVRVGMELTGFESGAQQTAAAAPAPEAAAAPVDPATAEQPPVPAAPAAAAQ